MAVSKPPYSAGCHRPIQEILRSVPWALILILLLALALRIYRLDEQSVYGDDIFAVFMRASTLAGYLKIALAYSVESVPVNYAFHYLWRCIFGIDHSALRLYGICLNLCSILLVYATAKELFCKRQALAAAILMALSPIQVFYAQSLSPYPLLGLTGAAALLTLLKAMNTRHPIWWFLNLACNIAVFWVHLAGVFILVTQGLLLLSRRIPIKTVFVWSCIHIVALIPSILHVMGTRTDYEGFYELFEPATCHSLLIDILADDVLYDNVEFIPSYPQWPQYPALRNLFVNFNEMAGSALIAFNAVCIFAATLFILRAVLQTLRTRSNPQTIMRAYNAAFPLILTVTPPVTLAVASHLFLPYFFPRYTFYAAPGICLLGAFFLYLFPPRLRPLFISLAIVLYASQTALLLASTVRTDWQSAAREVSQEASPDDLILIGGCTFSRLFVENGGTTQVPMLNLPYKLNEAYTFVPDIARAYLNQPSLRHNPCPANVWLLYPSAYTDGPIPELEHQLNEYGLTYNFKFYAGGEHIKRYRISIAPESLRPIPPPSAPGAIEMALASLPTIQILIPAQSVLKDYAAENIMLLGTLTPLFADATDLDLLRAQCGRIERAGLWGLTGTFFRAISHYDPATGAAAFLANSGVTVTDDNLIYFLLARTLPQPRIGSIDEFQQFITHATLPTDDPRTPEAALFEAAYQIAAADPERAVQCIQESLHRHPGHPELLISLARMMAQTNNWQEAQRLLQEAGEQHPVARTISNYILHQNTAISPTPPPAPLPELIRQTGVPLAPEWQSSH